MSNVIPISFCPICKYEMDRATYADKEERKPSPNDYSVCLKCGEILVFSEDLFLREATISDLMLIPSDVERQLVKLQHVIRRERVIE